MLLTPSGIVDISNGLVVTSISLHSAWPGSNGLSNELSGGSYARQSVLFPAAVTTPTRLVTADTTWSVPANATVAYYGLWNGSTLKAIAVNGGAEKEARRIQTTGSIYCPAHGLSVGNRVAIMGDWPSPFTEGDFYYVKSATPDTLSLSLSPTTAALAPATNNSNTNMILAKVDVQVFGGAGQFTVTGWDLKWRWTDAGPVVNPEPTGFRWKSDRPIPPQEIVLQAGQTYDFLAQLTGGNPTSVKIVSGETELNALGITYNEQLGQLVAGTSVTSGVADIVIRATNDVIVDYTGQEFYVRVFTDREWMPRDDSGPQHANTSYGLGRGFWTDATTKNGVSGQFWTGGELHTGIKWNYLTDFEATPIATFSYSGTVAAGALLTANITTAVKNIFDGKRNHGFLLKPGTGSGTRRFGSRENTDANYRPKLTINGVTITASSDGNLTNSETVDGATTFISVGGTSYAYVWFDLEQFWSDNSITASSQITSATITLTNNTAITGTATVTMHFMQPGGADYWTPPTPQTGIAWPGSATTNANVKVGLRDENIDSAVDENGNPCVLWSERYDVVPTASNYTQNYYIHYVQSPKMGSYDTASTTFSGGDVITGADSEYPSMGTMTPMYPAQKSLRMFWQGMDSPIGRLPYESTTSSSEINGLKVKSIGADGLFTLVNTYGDATSFNFGKNPFGQGATAYPRGYAPVYIRAGTKMPLPTGYTEQPLRVAQDGTVISAQQWGPPYYAMCVDSPGNNTFYLSATPFGSPIVPGAGVTADLSWTALTDYIRVFQARRRATGSFKLKIKPIAKNVNGTYKWPASAPYDFNGITSIPEFYFRAYFYVPSTFRLFNQGAKQIWGGVDGQFDGVIRGMGVGNGGLEGDLLGGGTIRGHSETESPVPLMQESNVIQLTSYTYVPYKGTYNAALQKYQMNGSYDVFNDSSSVSAFGDTFNWNEKAGLGFLEKDRWHCIEWYAKINSVVPNNEPIFIGDNVTPNYNCVINGVVQPCPTGYACYNPIHAIKDTSIDPATGKQRNPFGGPYPATFRSPIGLPRYWELNVVNSTSTTTLANGNTQTKVTTTDTTALTKTVVTTVTDTNGVVVSQNTVTTPLEPTFKYSYVRSGVTREYEMFGPTQSTDNAELGSFWGDANTGFNIGANIRQEPRAKDFRRAIIERCPTKPKYTPGQGGDGKYKVWFNGRQVLDRSDVYFRAVEWCKDGVTPFYFNGPMLVTQVGGVDRDFFECVTYWAHAVLSTRYIGPMKIS